jgi:hypothetical protein
MITKRKVFGSITILEDGQIQLRTDTIIEEDGEEIGRNLHRIVLKSGDDISSYPLKLRQIIAIVWS